MGTHRYAGSDAAVLESFNQVDAFGKLMSMAVEVAEQHAEMPAADVTAMFIALADFSGAVYPDSLDQVDLVLTSCYQVPPLLPLSSGWCVQHHTHHVPFSSKSGPTSLKKGKGVKFVARWLPMLVSSTNS